MRRIVVVGTGTGVGKTTVATTLAAALRAQGARVLCSKPVETGVTGSATDAALLGADAPHLGHPLYAYPDPVSPHLAAARAGALIDLAAISTWLRERENTLPAADAYSIVESAGGLFTPLTDTANNLTLTELLQPDWVLLVSPNCLGALHGVLSCLELLRRDSASWRVLVVLTAALPPDASSQSNAIEVTRLTGIAALSFDSSGEQRDAVLLAAQLSQPSSLQGLPPDPAQPR